MTMSPAASPSGIDVFPHRKLRVTRVSRRALALVFAIVAMLVVTLFVAIWNRGKGYSPIAEENPTKTTKAESAKPPTELMAIRPVKAVNNRDESTVPTSPDLKKERFEFDREIRRFAHQRHMQRLSRADQAQLAEMQVKGAELVERDSQAEKFGGMVDKRSADLVASSTYNNAFENNPFNSDPNLQVRKEQFAGGMGADSSYLPYRKEAPLSSSEIKQGTVIPAIMISGINSDLPGQIIAQVSQNVYDTVSGQKLLIPQGTRLVGSYDSFVAIGQERALVAWRRLIFPDGMSLELVNMGGADQGGYAGFNDQVNNHYTKIFGSAILLSFIGAGYQLSQPQPRAGEALSARDIVAAQMGQQLSQVSGEMMRRNMQIQPTIEIRPGYRFNVMVNHDMILDPYDSDE